MDPKATKREAPVPVRRSTRQASAKAVGYEATPRPPLKARKRPSKQAPVAAVNGSRDQDSASEDGETQRKKSRLGAGGKDGGGEDDDGGGDEDEMEVQADGAEENDQQMDEEKQDSPHDTHPPFSDTFGQKAVLPCIVLRDCQQSQAVNVEVDLIRTKIAQPPTKRPEATKPAVQTRRPANSHDVPAIQTSMADYRSRMEEPIAGRPVIPAHNNVIPVEYQPAKKTGSVHQRQKNIQTKSQHVLPVNKDGKNKKIIKTSPRKSSRGCMWYFWRLLSLVLLCSAAFLACKKFLVLKMVTNPGGHVPRAAELDDFAHSLSLLEAKFPHQIAELWKRSKIHLGKHLGTAQPTEPVSMILTAGRNAETTLCALARGLASAYSSAVGASVLQIDGAGKGSRDGDEVKLEIDSQLKQAFEGGKPVAIIHRLEELPAGSTLIFYRYCDHETAAYKRVFLLFTVLLPQDEVGAEHSLKDAEEMVQDYLKERLVGSNSQADFNQMDVDKFGGLWSRISHLVLPVASEQEVEREGCERASQGFS